MSEPKFAVGDRVRVSYVGLPPTPGIFFLESGVVTRRFFIAEGDRHMYLNTGINQAGYSRWQYGVSGLGFTVPERGLHPYRDGFGILESVGDQQSLADSEAAV